MYSGKVADSYWLFRVHYDDNDTQDIYLLGIAAFPVSFVESRFVHISPHIKAPAGGSETELDKLLQVVKHLVDFPLKAHSKIFAGMWIGHE